MLDRALGELARVGLTSVHDPGVDVAQDPLSRACADDGTLTTRVYGMIAGTHKDFAQLAVRSPLNDYSNGL